MNSFDQGKAALDDLVEWAASHTDEVGRNEATTRLHLIDSLLIEVLRWPKSAVRAETSSGGGRIDYALGVPGVQCLVEAKREGAVFQLPAGTETGVRSISGLVAGEAGRLLLEALEQVSRYAAAIGVAPAAVTNGHQVVAFIAVRTDGVAPLQGKAVVFPSLEDMRDDFRLLWDCLSPVGIDQRVLHRRVMARDVLPPEPLSSGLPDYPGVKRRNNLQAGLEILGEMFLLDVADIEELRTEFLRDCYATSGALSQYAEVTKQVLRTRYALLRAEGGPDAAPVEDKKGISQDLTHDMLAAAVARRPIVLLGDVGVGKTTFIKRLVHVEATDIFQKALNLYLDFGSSTALGSLSNFVVEESIRQLRTSYGLDIEELDFVESVYHEELKRFDRGIAARLKEIDPIAYEKERINYLKRRLEDRPGHVRDSLDHLRSTTRRQVVIFLDNIDQRSSEDQERVFLIANELAQTWPATVFVTLRPDTFYRSSRDGTLSGYQPRVFTIAPPRTDIMLQRRIDFVLDQLKRTGRLGSFPVGVTLDSTSLLAFLEVLAENFRTNRDLLSLIDNLAGGNMRLALEFVTKFLGSGHINTKKILELYREVGRYPIPLHEFLKAILYLDGVYYEPDASPIANVFRVTRPDGREHFLLPLLLSHIQSLGEQAGDEGYVGVDQAYAFANNIGFETDQIASALDYAVKKRLLDAIPRYSIDRPRLHYRITTVGAYTTRVLLAYFAYVDAVVVDTPVTDQQYRAQIQDCHTLADRVSRSEYFRLYLDRQWDRIAESGTSWRWPDNSARLAEDIRRVGQRADPEVWGW